MTRRRAGGPTVSRRSFLKGGLGLGAVGALGLTGCSFTPSSGGGSDLGGTTQLRMLNWSDYIDPPSEDGSSPGTLERVRAELGLQVAYDESYADSYDGFQIILDRAVNRENPEFDLVVPVNWRAAQMIASDWVEPIPLELVPNHVNLDPAYMSNSWDRGSRYQMPWQTGITGIAYDPALTGRPLTSINDLFDPRFKGRVGLLGEMREAVGLAMLANGDDPSRPTVQGAEAGLNRVREAIQGGQVKVVSDDFDDKLASGELIATMAWSGDTAVLQGDRPDIEFVIPDEGAIQWFDAMVIPKRAANIAAAGRFMNYVYDPANAARITAYVGYISPVLGVQDVLRASGPDGVALADSPVLFPDAAARNRLFTWGGLDPETETRLDDEFLRLVP